MGNIKEAERFEKEWQRLKKTLKTIELLGFDKEWGGDEIVASNCSVHLEQMDKDNYYLGIRTAREYIQVSIGSDSGRAKIRAVVYDGGKVDAS